MPTRWRGHDTFPTDHGCRGAIFVGLAVLAILAVIVGFWWSFA